MVFAQTSGPQSETELLLRRPASYRPGSLPQGILPVDETILFETRPGLLRLFWGRLVLLGFVVFFWTSLAAVGGTLLLLDPLWILIEFLLFLAIAWVVLDWHRTAYVLTNHRILRVGGARRNVFQDAHLDQVENLSLEPGTSGGVNFTVGPGAPVRPGAPSTGRARMIRWIGIADAPQVYTFVQQAFALRVRQQVMHDPASPHHPSAGVVSCPGCGAVLETRNLSQFRPVCVRCGYLFHRPA